MFIKANTPGVYFIWNDENEVIYIGSSSDLRQRIPISHRERGGTSYSFIVSDNYKDLEKRYIWQCSPKLNVTYNEAARNPSPLYPDLEQYPFLDDVKKTRKSFLLSLDKDIYEHLQRKARVIAYEEDRNYSVTELINDILNQHVHPEEVSND
ncbi:MAG: GIY-YIG nuclease family protein [Flexilinea sp.]|nr:GIY-YIG nuclease family protein [Flexilinea sp.]